MFRVLIRRRRMTSDVGGYKEYLFKYFLFINVIRLVMGIYNSLKGWVYL